MNSYFDEQKWLEAIKRPDWYIELYPEFERLMTKAETLSPEERHAIGEAVYGFLERQLEAGAIALGTEGKNWDAERRPIDTIVIHHTKCPPGITWRRLSAMHLIRLYAKSYFFPSTEKEIQGKPVFSHHFRDEGQTNPPAGRQVFYSYHWLIRMDGDVERLLPDDETGWQAGSWEINCRSVAICLDNNFESATPPDVVLSAAADIIKKYYPHVSPEKITGHREVNPHTSCPGEQFLNDWKKKLLTFCRAK